MGDDCRQHWLALTQMHYRPFMAYFKITIPQSIKYLGIAVYTCRICRNRVKATVIVNGNSKTLLLNSGDWEEVHGMCSSSPTSWMLMKVLYIKDYMWMEDQPDDHARSVHFLEWVMPVDNTGWPSFRCNMCNPQVPHHLYYYHHQDRRQIQRHSLS